jgi:hypothetical protein
MTITTYNVQTGETKVLQEDAPSFTPVLTPSEVLAAEQAARIAELKQLLRDSDYVALPDYDKDKADVIAQRQAWRDEIRSLEA